MQSVWSASPNIHRYLLCGSDSGYFGGYTEWEGSMEYLVGQKVYFDTSSTLWKLPVETAKKMMQAHGIDNFLFGSDFPMWDHEDELERFNQLELNAEDREKVLYKNAAALLKTIGYKL